jgi:heme-degrading monooxygenase HmoA
MVLEVALIDVKPGEEDAFAAAYGTARATLASTPGCRTVRMTRGIESPSRFVLLVEWDSVAAHEENFRATERFTTWRGLIGPYFAQPPVVEHFTDV